MAVAMGAGEGKAETMDSDRHILLLNSLPGSKSSPDLPFPQRRNHFPDSPLPTLTARMVSLKVTWRDTGQDSDLKPSCFSGRDFRPPDCFK